MWYMTHTEPTRVTTTRVRVKARARKVQPPSDFVFMCRKQIMWTTICTAASAMMTMLVLSVSFRTLPITSQNGIAVRTTDRTKPVT